MGQESAFPEDGGGPTMRRLTLALLRRQGQAAVHSGRHDRARGYYERALALNESDPDLWALLGSVTPDGETRLICARQALRLAPDHTLGRLLLDSPELSPSAVLSFHASDPASERPFVSEASPQPAVEPSKPLLGDGQGIPLAASVSRTNRYSVEDSLDSPFRLSTPALHPSGQARPRSVRGRGGGVQALVLPRPIHWRPSPLLRLRLLASLLLLLLVSLNLVLAAAYVRRYHNRFAPGVQIAGLDVGGLSQAEAAARLQQHVDDILDWRIVLRNGEQSWSFRARDIGLRYRIESACREAWQIGRRDSAWVSWWERLAPIDRRVPLQAEVRSDRLQAGLAQVAAEVDRPAIPPAAVWQDGRWEIQPGQDGRRVDRSVLRERIVNALAGLVHGDRPPPGVAVVLVVPVSVESAALSEAVRDRLHQQLEWVARPLHLRCGEQRWVAETSDISRWLRVELGAGAEGAGLGIDLQEVQAYLFQVAPQVVEPAELPRMEVFHGDVVALQAGSDGRQLDIDNSSARIESMLRRRLAGEEVDELELITEVVRAGDEILLSEMEVLELIGEGSSSFVGSPWNRSTNIQVGGWELHGRLIAPGEIFSLNETLSPITRAKGYVASEVIVGGRVVMGLGGGLCQVATTLYRAALFSGLEIVERHPHVWRLAWYEQDAQPGFDATIAMGGPDLRLRNNTEHYLLIQVETDIEQGRQTIRFYGISPGWQVVVDNYTMTNGGYTVSYRRTVTRDGEVLIEETISSRYSAR